MIVKNEKHIIKETLDNLTKYINFNYWVISDTGSTDGTQEFIKEYFIEKNIPGELFQDEWQDFAYNRNLAIEHAFNKSDYLFFFDADDLIHGDFKLPDTLNKDAYQFKFSQNFSYDRICLINNREKIGKYVGVLHELFNISKPDCSIEKIEGDYFFESRRLGDRSKNPEKYKKDGETLEIAFNNEMTDLGLKYRYAYYCGQSYQDGGIHEKSIEWFKKFLDLPADNQYKYCACINLGHNYKNINNNEQSIYYYGLAYKYDNTRIEGITFLMDYYYSKNLHFMVNALWNKFKNYEVLNPKHKIFLNSDRYHWFEWYNIVSGYYSDDYNGAYSSCKRSVINNYNIPNVLQNLIFYKQQYDNDNDNNVKKFLFDHIKNNNDIDNFNRYSEFIKSYSREKYDLLYNDFNRNNIDKSLSYKSSNKILIYSCVFFNEKYIHLINLLLKSYKLFGNSSDDVDYLIICNPNFQKKIQAIFDNLNISGKIWCIDLKTKFEAGYSRLKIFDYPDINLYNKILYLDCDILVTNSINNILDFQLENQIYVLKEHCHRFYHCQLFTDEEYNLLDKSSVFSSGILLFNNNIKIKDLFSQILLHINNHITNNLPIPVCLEQPFIVYHAVKSNLYNNQKLINIVINNPNNFNNETISHFPGGPGNYEDKILKMNNFMNNVMFNFNKNNYFKIQIVDYENILVDNKNHFDKLYSICKEIGENVEGNCFTEHLNIDNKINELIYKQLNHFTLGFKATNIMEIGFNAGHSSLLYLLANPNSKLTIFDICEHKYTIPCFNYLQLMFPNRLEIFPGNSTKTIPEFINNNPSTKFDLIHIDGAHFEDVPNKDFYNSLSLASDIIIWDDTQIKTLDDLLNGYIKKGLVYEIFLYKTLVYEHRICRVNQLLNKTYIWENSYIEFLEYGKMNAFGEGKYAFIDKYLVKCDFGGTEHLLKFNTNYSTFISIRKQDFDVISGSIYKNKLIPKIIIQTAKYKPEQYIIDLINQKCPGYIYKHFIDNEIIEYFIDNPIKEFPNIIEKFNSFSKGQHKADLFRYYYLYLNGGIFLDSDAIFEKHIDSIIKSYDCIFINSFMTDNLIFNGFIATYPKNPIIYDALKHAYQTEDMILQKHYHYLCEELWKIYHKHNLPNMKIYQEYNRYQEGYGGSIILDDNGNKIISHYWCTKKIPKIEKIYTLLKHNEINYKSEFTNIYNNNHWVKGSGIGSYIENTITYNKYIIDFINSNNIKSVIDLGCGDWQSSYLIYDKLPGINYTGIDCVDSVIENNIKRFKKYNFLSFDFIKELELIKNIEKSDLIILKDVLQHLQLIDIYKLLDFITLNVSFRFIIITNNSNQLTDDLKLEKILCGRGLHSSYLPLKKYNAIPLLDYWGGENKHICLIQNNYTMWNNYNNQEINIFDPRVLIGYDCPYPLIRVGPKTDGGYVIIDGFNYDHFLSCGIADDIRFEVAFLDKYPNLRCDAFDGTINNFPQHNKNINWVKKNIGYINTEKITNLKPYIKNFKNIFLKMDIEGFEFNWIDSMNLEDLNCFSQIVIEIHWPFDKYRYEMLKKLNQTHFIVHIHGNNYCDRDIPNHLPSGRTYNGTININHANYPSINLPEVFEITYIRKNNFINNLTKIEKKYPTLLDWPNNPNTKDIEFTINVETS